MPELTVKARPIIFSAESVRAILAGQKTQTRRVVKPQPWEWDDVRKRTGMPSHPRQMAPYLTGRPEHGMAYYWQHGGCWNSSPPIKCPLGWIGERLWVREPWVIGDWNDDGFDVFYLATESRRWFAGRVPRLTNRDEPHRGRSPIHMPRWASRLTLEITDVRVERVQSISEHDCEREIGVEHFALGNAAYETFRELWDKLNAKRGYGWDVNPFVWAVTFQEVKTDA